MAEKSNNDGKKENSNAKKTPKKSTSGAKSNGSKASSTKSTSSKSNTTKSTSSKSGSTKTSATRSGTANKSSASKSDTQKAVEKVYKSARKTAKKHGKLRQFNIAVTVLLVVALTCGMVYYFVFYEPKDNTPGGNKVTSFTFDVYQEENLNHFNIIENRGKLEVHYIDVGQADCILIKLPDGRNMLIDAGGKKDTIKAYLDKEGVRVIDYALLTHTDSDHVESFDDVLSWYEIKNLFIPKLYPNWKAGKELNRYKDITAETKIGVIDTKGYYEFFTKAHDETYTDESGKTQKAKVYPNVDFMNISGTGYEIDIYCMADETYNKEFKTAAQKNEISPSVVLTYQGKQFLFTGDGIGTSHDNFVKEYNKRNTKEMDFDVYKAAHHGSSTHSSNNEEFLKMIKTEYTVISVKEGSYNDMPSVAVMENMIKYGNKIYRTDKYGDVVFGVKDNTLYTPEQMAA